MRAPPPAHTPHTAHPPMRAQDAVKKITGDELPDFYNIVLERPKDDPAGYDVLYIDAAHKVWLVMCVVCMCVGGRRDKRGGRLRCALHGAAHKVWVVGQQGGGRRHGGRGSCTPPSPTQPPQRPAHHPPPPPPPSCRARLHRACPTAAPPTAKPSAWPAGGGSPLLSTPCATCTRVGGRAGGREGVASLSPAPCRCLLAPLHLLSLTPTPLVRLSRRGADL